MCVARADILGGDAVLAGAPFDAADVVLLSKEEEDIQRNLDVLDFLADIKAEAYVDEVWCIMYVLIVSCIAASVWYHKPPYKFILKYFWRIVSISQDEFNPTNTSNRIVWLFLLWSIFIIICGYVKNTMRTELVATQRLPKIEQLSDLFTPEFELIQPMIIKDLFFDSLKSTVRQKSDLKKLFDKTHHGNGYIYADYAQQSSTFFTSLEESLQNRSKMLAVTDFFYQRMRTFVCIFRPSFIRGLHEGSQMTAKGSLVYFYSKSIDSTLRKYVNYRQTTVLEMGIVATRFNRITDLLLHKFGFANDNVEKLTCRVRYTHEEEVPVKSFPIRVCKKTFQLWFVGVMVSFIVLVMEHFVNQISRCYERRKRVRIFRERKKRQKVVRIEQKIIIIRRITVPI